MEWAALISWIVTAGGGFVLLSIWLARGGMQQSDNGNRIRPPLILSHFLLAATGLVIWVIYLVTDSDALAWIALAILVVVAVLGWTMFFTWLRRRRARMAGEAGAAPAGSALTTPAEQHFPIPVVALHGVLAVTTVLLVFLTAIGVGES
jgi:hypothetical protein